MLHRMIRRGTSYGPPLPEGALDDDGVDRGLMFAFVGAHPGRQFEFVQSEWMNNSDFFGGRASKDPVAGANAEEASFNVPRRPLPLRLEFAAFRAYEGRRICVPAGDTRLAMARRSMTASIWWHVALMSLIGPWPKPMKRCATRPRPCGALS
jgi:hypothetical protein